MMHLDDETVTMIAFGERDIHAEERDHLDQCPRCRLELDAIRHLASVGHAAAEVELVAPAPGVWHAIHAELALTDAVSENPLSAPEPAESGPSAPSRPSLFPAASAGDADASFAIDASFATDDSSAADDSSDDDSAGASARVTPIHRARGGSGFGRWWPMAAAALFVGIVAGVIGTQMWPTAPEQVLAEAALDPFPNWQASGSAQLAEVDGVRELIVDLEAPSGGLREVWLINPETSGLLSLGLLDGTSGQFRIPTGVDLTSYTVVDISEEPDDGNPGHSGDSIVRGELRGA